MLIHVMRTKARRGARTLSRFAAVAGVLALPLTACDEILEVEDPDVALPDQFTDETALPALRAATIGDFAAAYVGTGAAEGQILTAGLLADEFFHSGTFPTRAQVDIRKIADDNATLEGVTRRLYRARTTAELAADRFAELAPRSAGFAEVLNLGGFTFVYFAENYCSGVPFSQVLTTGEFEFGAPETTQQIFERALETFNKGIAAAQAALDTLPNSAAAQTQLNLAKVGKARTLIGLARYQEAAMVAQEVPTNFAYRIERSDNTTFEQNGVFVFNVIVERWSVPNTEGGNGLPYRSHLVGDEFDPRVPWQRVPPTDVGFDGTTPQYDQLLYKDRSAPVVVGSGIEARLIEAEAELQEGDIPRMIAILNELRAASGLEPLPVPATRDAAINILFEERAYWLWLTSHRLGDMRRLIRPAAQGGYGFSANNVYPEGDYHKSVFGGTYGEDVSLPITIDEANNPAALNASRQFIPCDNTVA